MTCLFVHIEPGGAILTCLFSRLRHKLLHIIMTNDSLLNRQETVFCQPESTFPHIQDASLHFLFNYKTNYTQMISKEHQHLDRSQPRQYIFIFTPQKHTFCMLFEYGVSPLSREVAAEASDG